MAEINSGLSKPKILITGGSGFLGSRIVEELLAEDSLLKPAHLKVFDITEYQGVGCDMVEFIKGDIRNLDTVLSACDGIDIVIHTAAIIDWGTKSKEEVLDINVKGTENVIQACQKLGINHLVYTSSLDAVFTGKPLVDIDESEPYPDTHHTVYCESKKLAELAVKNANNNGLKTCILRPSDIYGENDPYHIDSLIDMAKSGFYVRLGDGKSKCQHVYVGNMAHAHVLATAALWNGNQKVNGEVYFITDGKASNFFKFFDRVVVGAGYRLFPKNLWLPKGLAFTIGTISEIIAILWRPIKKYNPKFSRFAVTYTCTDFTFNSEKAKADLDFQPKYNLEESLERTVSFYKRK